MGIEYGVEVIDKNGRKVGTVNRVIRDAYSTEIKKFTVATDSADVDLFFSPEEVHETTDTAIKLDVALSETESMEVNYGAEVVDKKGRRLGTVDYPIRDTLTGEIRSFKVKTPDAATDLIFSHQDLLEVTPERVKINLGEEEIDSSKQI